MQKFLISVGIFYGLFCLLVFLFQKNLMFFPDRTPFSECPLLKKLGGSIHKSPDGKTRLYHLPPKQAAKGWVLHFHGNGGRACHRIETTHEFSEMGFHVVLVEYPGYSEEEGLPALKEILENAESSYDYIASQNHNALPVVLYGESLGTGPATYLASKELKFLSSLILQTPFPDLASVAQAHYYYLPVRLLLREDFNTKEWAKSVKVPVFAFHGTDDEVIPFKLGKQQAGNFAKDLITFWEAKGAHHNDLLYVVGNELWKRIEDFLNNRRGHANRPMGI